MARKKQALPERGTVEWAAMLLEAMNAAYPLDADKVEAFRGKMSLPDVGKRTWKQRTGVLAEELGACIAELQQTRLLQSIFFGSALQGDRVTAPEEKPPEGGDVLLYVPGDGSAQ